MKKITLMMLALVLSAVAFAQQPLKLDNVKEAPEGLVKKMLRQKAQAAPHTRRAQLTVADIVGDYTWYVKGYSDVVPDPTTIESDATTYSSSVTISASEKDGYVNITGDFFARPLEARLVYDSDTDGDYNYLEIADNQNVYTSSTYGDCSLRFLFYYEGETTDETGWYYMNYNYIDIYDEGMLFDTNRWIIREILEGEYAGYNLTPYYLPGSYLIPNSTGIQGIKNDATAKDQPVYNLNGQRVSNPEKGLFITNGKKVVIK